MTENKREISLERLQVLLKTYDGVVKIEHISHARKCPCQICQDRARDMEAVFSYRESLK